MPPALAAGNADAFRMSALCPERANGARFGQDRPATRRLPPRGGALIRSGDGRERTTSAVALRPCRPSLLPPSGPRRPRRRRVRQARAPASLPGRAPKPAGGTSTITRRRHGPAREDGGGDPEGGPLAVRGPEETGRRRAARRAAGTDAGPGTGRLIRPPPGPRRGPGPRPAP